MYTPPFNHILVKPVSLEHRTIVQQKTAPRLLGNLICCRCTVQDDLGKDAVCSAADPASEVCTDLPGDQVRVRSLRGKDQVNAKGTALSGDHDQFTFDLTNQLPLLCRKSCLVQQLSNLIASKKQCFNGIFAVLLYSSKLEHAALLKSCLWR